MVLHMVPMSSVKLSRILSFASVFACLQCTGITYGEPAMAMDAQGQGGESARHFSGFSHNYADKFHGRRTASGQLHDKTKLTCAHRTLPFGTHLHVTNRRNGKSCVVVVNDRGPFTPNVVLDVSRAAAQELGFTGGKIPIDCVILDKKTVALLRKESANKTPKEPTELAAFERKPQKRVEGSAKKAVEQIANKKPSLQVASAASEQPGAKHDQGELSAIGKSAEKTFLLVINGAIESQAHTDSEATALDGSFDPGKALRKVTEEALYHKGKLANKTGAL